MTKTGSIEHAGMKISFWAHYHGEGHVEAASFSDHSTHFAKVRAANMKSGRISEGGTIAETEEELEVAILVKARELYDDTLPDTDEEPPWHLDFDQEV
jgi:hypothetical protein